MKVWIDKKGNKLTPKEFAARWKEGILRVTPLQRTNSQIFFTWIILLGLSAGIITSAIADIKWLIIVLSGAFGLQVISLITLFQQWKTFKNIELQLKGGVAKDV